jgi:hypothetical protein
MFICEQARALTSNFGCCSLRNLEFGWGMQVQALQEMPQELMYEDALQALIQSSGVSAVVHAPGQPMLVFKPSPQILSPPRTPSPHPIQQLPPLAVEAQGTRPFSGASAAPMPWGRTGLPPQCGGMTTQMPPPLFPPPSLKPHRDGVPYHTPHGVHCLEGDPHTAAYHAVDNPLRSGQLSPMPPYYAAAPQPPVSCMPPLGMQPVPPAMGHTPPAPGAQGVPPKKARACPGSTPIETAVIALLRSRNAYDGPKSQAVEAMRSQLQQIPEVAGNPVLASPTAFHTFLLCLPCVQVCLSPHCASLCACLCSSCMYPVPWPSSVPSELVV